MNNNNIFLEELFILAMKEKNMVSAHNIFTELQAIINNPLTPMNKIVRLIENDPGMTSIVLKTANSSFFGLSKKVSTIKQAITVVGFTSLKNILISFSFKNTFNDKQYSLFNDLWQHSLATAIATKNTISINYPKYGDYAFVAGLLHDFGKFILLNLKPNDFGKITQKIKINSYQYSIPLEIEIFGVDHPEIGSFFSKKWLFPDAVVDSIKDHHHLENAIRHKEFVAAVAFGNNIAKALEIGSSTSGLIEFLPHWVYTLLGLNTGSFEYIINKTQSEYAELTQTLGGN